MPMKDQLPLISAVMGFIAITFVLAIGTYLIAQCWSIYTSTSIHAPSFLTVTITSWILILTSALLLTFGSLKTSRKSTRRGGLINLAAGIEIIPLFIYFHNIFPLLPQFDPLGFLLFIPAMLSGIIGLASPKHSRTERTHASFS